MLLPPVDEEYEDDSEMIVEEAKNVEEPIVPVTPIPAATTPTENAQSSGSMWKTKLHLFGVFIFTLVAYVIPLSFTGYLFSSEVKQSVHTLVKPDQLSFIADRIFTYVEYKDQVYAFIGFRATYILCLWVSGILVGLV